MGAPGTPADTRTPCFVKRVTGATVASDIPAAKELVSPVALFQLLSTVLDCIIHEPDHQIGLECHGSRLAINVRSITGRGQLRKTRHIQNVATKKRQIGYDEYVMTSTLYITKMG